ncbi:MAG: AMP-binding protein, partial [Deltaproteobacteria bacterium]|nr:AMP-binding protein [Deltaproteobacteria bacterium]
PLKKKIAAWARKKGLEGGYGDQKGEPKPFLYGLADKLVFSKVREKLGLDRCRLQVSAAAPISMDTLEFFLSLGIPITEVYGMSENTGPGTVATPDNYKTGTAGPAMIGTEVKIADDGEVLMRGRHVFMGYFKNEEETKKTIDSDGWLHSGDIGEIDSKGFLKITDRKKELIITAGGENIAPQLLEGKVKAIPVVSQATVIGDRRKYLTALITLDPEKVAGEASAIGSLAKNATEAAKCDIFVKHLQGLIDEVNKTLARVQTIKKFTIAPEEFSIEGGELTPTMKLKRRIIYDKYSDDIENMYT